MTSRYFCSTTRRLSFMVNVRPPLSKVKSSGSRAKRLMVSHCARCVVRRAHFVFDELANPRVRDHLFV